MPILDTVIELQTHRETTSLRMSNIDKFADGSGYCCDLRLWSGRFYYQGPFYFHGHFVNEAINGIRQMLAGQVGEVVLKGLYEEDALWFAMDELGHVAVRGLLNEYTVHRQFLRFHFVTDQTVLNQLLQDLISLNGA
jgi:hypothetical protein